MQQRKNCLNFGSEASKMSLYFSQMTCILSFIYFSFLIWIDIALLAVCSECLTTKPEVACLIPSSSTLKISVRGTTRLHLCSWKGAILLRKPKLNKSDKA